MIIEKVVNKKVFYYHNLGLYVKILFIKNHNILFKIISHIIKQR